MPRAAARFKQADISRLVKAAKASGFEIGQIIIETGGAIRLVTQSNTEQDNLSVLEKWKQENEGRNPPKRH
jgi:hypothetical protein